MMNNNQNIPQGYKDSPLGVIPQEWEVKRIKDVITYIGGGAFSSKDSTDDGARWLKIANIGINEIKWGEESFLPESYLQEYPELLLQEGDIVMALTRPILDNKLKIAIITDEDAPALLNQRVAKVQAKEDGCKMFFYYCLQKPKFIAEMESDMLGTDPPNASFDSMYKQKIAVPPFDEQRNIAEVLGCWDKAIERQGRMVELLTTRKRALMQRLLTPQPHWQKTKLGEIAERVTRKNTENNTNVMTISAQRGFVSQTDFFNKSIASETLDNYFLVYKDEFCYNKSYCNGYPMGAIKRLNNADKAVVTTLYICFRIKTGKYNIEFFEQYFEAGLLNRHLMKIANEGGRAHGLLNVTPTDFFAMMIDIPPLAEQKSIAEKLSTVDAEIDLARHRLDLLRTQKRALMQQLLTGKKRLQ